MAKSDYALCEVCDGKAVYDGDGTIRDSDDVLIVHKGCGRVVPAEMDRDALTAAHKAVEDALADFRDRRISVFARNGLVILERDGTESAVMRLSTHDALQIGIRAYLAHQRGEAG